MTNLEDLNEAVAVALVSELTDKEKTDIVRKALLKHLKVEELPWEIRSAIDAERTRLAANIIREPEYQKAIRLMVKRLVPKVIADIEKSVEKRMKQLLKESI